MPRLKNRTLLLLLSMALLMTPAIYARDADHPAVRTMPQGAWQRLTNDKAFAYRNEKEQLTINHHPNSALIKTLQGIVAFFNSTAGKFIFWGALLAIVGYALYRIWPGNKSLFSRRANNLNAAQQPEEDLAADWEKLLQTALSQHDTRMAIRCMYMRLLQLLQEHALIHYKNDKTNYDYYNELSETQYKQPFKQLSRTYEYAWYGHLPVSANAFDEYNHLYMQVKKQLFRQ